MAETVNSEGKLIKENRCLEDFPEHTFPSITYGTSVPSNSSGSNGDVFILLED